MSLGLERKQLVMVAVLLSGTFLAVLNATLLTPALPSIMVDLGIPSTTAQWLTSGYSLVEAVVIPLSAFLMGRLSTRKLYLGGIFLFLLGSIMAALAPSFTVLLLGRVCQALATGAILPMVISVVLLMFPPERRGSAMGVVSLLIGFAPAIGPTLSGAMVDSIGWRSIFVIVSVLSILIFLTAIFTLENYGEFKRTSFDLLSVIFSTIGLLCLLYGLSSFSSSENYILTLGLVVFGLIVIGIYVYRQLHMDIPMLRVDILKVRNYRIVVVLVMIFMAGLIGMETVMPLYIQNVLGHSATISGLTLLPGALIGGFIGLISGRIFDAKGVRLPVLIGSGIITLAAVGFFTFQVDSPIVYVSVVYAIMVIGIQFTMTPLNTWGINSLSNNMIQHAQSTSNTLNQVASSFGIALLVSIAALVSGMVDGLSSVEATYVGYHASFTATAILVVIAMLVILGFVRDRKGSQQSRTAATVAEVLAEDVDETVEEEDDRMVNVR